MKRLSKILIVLIGLFPLILNASVTSEEVKYRFYENLEDNIHYELYPENTCKNEIVNYDNYIYTDYIFTNEKPDERENRVIEPYDGTLNISTDYVNYITINNFENILGKTSDMRRVELFDDKGVAIPYTIMDYRNFGPYPHTGGYINDYPGSLNDEDISESVLTNANSSITLKLSRIVYLKDLTIKVTYKDVNDGFSGLTYFGRIDNYFYSMMPSNYSEKTIECNTDNICTMTIKTPDFPGSDDTTINTRLYKYKDAMYKCYSLKRKYIPGYYTSLEGFIKDSEKYKVETIISYEDEKDTLVSMVNELKNDNSKLETSLNEIKSSLNTKVDNLSNNNQNIIDKINSYSVNEEELKEKIDSIILKNEEITKYIEIIRNNSLNKEEFLNFVSLINNNNEELRMTLSSMNNNEELKSYVDELYGNNAELINSILEEKENIEETDGGAKDEIDKDLIAMKDTNVKEIKYDNLSTFLVVFGSLCLLVSLLVYYKNVKKSRTK